MTRLQELVEQATHKVLGVRQIDSIILAELIVAECVEVCQKLANEYAKDRVDQDDYSAAVVEGCGVALKEHFNIK
jgi:hypothetical protein